MRSIIPSAALIVLGLLAVSCVSSDLRAQDVDTKGGQSAKRADLNALATGEQFISNGETYVVLPGARALRHFEPDEEPSRALTKMGLGGQEILQLKGSFIIYRATGSNDSHSKPMLDSVQGRISFPVVLNKRTGQLGVVPGNLVVKLKNMTQAAHLADAHGLRIASRFDHLNLVFYSVGVGKDIHAAVQLLKADQRVESAEIEILENINVPH